MWGKLCIFESHFLELARRGLLRIVVKTKIGHDSQINNLLLRNVQYIASGALVYKSCEIDMSLYASTVKLRRIKLCKLPPLVLGEIIENQNSDFVMTYI